MTEGGKGPRRRREVKPVYSIEAMTEKKQGVVAIEAVVLRDGSICFTRSAFAFSRRAVEKDARPLASSTTRAENSHEFVRSTQCFGLPAADQC
jgi:hypothetical protein